MHENSFKWIRKKFDNDKWGRKTPFDDKKNKIPKKYVLCADVSRGKTAFIAWHIANNIQTAHEIIWITTFFQGYPHPHEYKPKELTFRYKNDS